ncbi:MAG: hydrolase [Leptospira sp.]|nr:hydrolase [Leptospira sp.]NCS95404.1 hydrolase [Leptospira sp.]
MSEDKPMEGKYSNSKEKVSWKYYFIFSSWLFLCLLSFYLGIGLIHWEETESDPKQVYHASMGDGVVKAFQEENKLSTDSDLYDSSEDSSSNFAFKNVLEELFSSDSKEDGLGSNNTKDSNKSGIRSSTWFSDYEAMKKVVHLYDEIHPFIYSMKGGLTNNGELANSWSSKSKHERVAELRILNPKVKIIPTIFRWENPKEKISENIGMNGRSDIRDKHIQIIVNEVMTFDYDGIDIDYEGMSCEKKEKFEEFIVLLSKELKKNNKLLSVAVHPKTPNPKGKVTKCKGLKNDIVVDFKENWRGPMTHDYEFLGKHVDRLKVMAYELHPRKYRNPGPGPQAPNVWLKEIIKYAKKRVPSEKLYMAIPTYGYDWALNCNSSAKSVYYSDVKRIKALNPIIHQPTDITTILSQGNRNTSWTNLSKFGFVHENKIYEDPTMWYTAGGCDRVAFFMNRKAFEEKMTLLRKYELAGFSFWQLISDNDPEINKYLELLATNQLPPVPIANDLYADEKPTVIADAASAPSVKGKDSKSKKAIASPQPKIEKHVEAKKIPLNTLTSSKTNTTLRESQDPIREKQPTIAKAVESTLLKDKEKKLDENKALQPSLDKIPNAQVKKEISESSSKLVPVNELPTAKPQEVPSVKPLKEDIIYE